jgi:photosystem II stability/assembly factor-like uncharacterized protein
MVVSLASAGDALYLGTADGHVFLSQDGARSWELRGRVGTRLDAVVTSIVADPRGGRVFAAVWYQEPGAGGGVFESSDQGQTWKLLGLQAEAVRALELAPSLADQLVAGTRTGVFLSSDAGKTWARISPEGDEEIRNLDSLAIDPRNPQVIYTGTYHLPWLTRDGGKNWKPVIAGIIDDSDIMSLRLDASNPDRVFMSACSGIYRSENQGGEWVKLQGIPYAARRTQVIVQDPGNSKTLYAGTTEGLWVTRDGGESWARTTSKNWVVNTLVVLGAKDGAPGRVVLGTEGQGIQVSDDAGMNFTAANQGFTHIIVKKLIADKREAGRLLMVVERSSAEILESRDDGRSWLDVPMAVQDHGNPAMLDVNGVQDALSSPWGWLLRSENGKLWLWEEGKKSWKEWKLALPASPPEAAKANHKPTARNQSPRQLARAAVIAFSQDAAVVSTSESLLRCQESGSCLRIKAFPHGDVRAVSLSSSGRELAVVMDGKLGWSTDGGETAIWRDLPVTAQEVFWLDLPKSDQDENLLLGTSKGVFVSQVAAGSPWQTAAGGLPAGQMDQFLHLPNIWSVSERHGGLYLSRDSGASWNRVDRDAERGRFTGLVGTRDGAVLAGSQSEGLLRLEMNPNQEK